MLHSSLFFANTRRETSVLYPETTTVLIGLRQPVDASRYAKFSAHAINKPWPDEWTGVFNYIRLSFLDGAVDWNFIIQQASRCLDLDGVISIVDIRADIQHPPYMEAEHRMRAHTSSARDALQQARLHTRDCSEQRDVQAGVDEFNDRDLASAIVWREKEFFAGALLFSHWRSDRAGVIANYAQALWESQILKTTM